MTSAEDPLSRSDDSILGELSWNESAWIGAVELGTHRVRLVIDLDEENITRAQQVESIEYAKALHAKVLKNETSLRRQCAQEIAEAAGSRASEEDRRRYLAEVTSAAASMEPQVLCIDFPDGGHLEYRDTSGKFYGNSTVVIRFDSDAQYEEAEVELPDRE
ncbi:hypothetical protein [Variovorax sp. PAMC26660]|uniref:hypothetical protein n=1 Tax=Variovorax sp. PAMC26660 TaxID=2762322 RepID=UPI00164ED990|nr:hypothetical protein [Variovorax sp. PAMC26660]QNK67753.1 hypothetical protein H7F35_32280 [Variovorax sp. PAMC26660]